jgi:hypothetical protein
VNQCLALQEELVDKDRMYEFRTEQMKAENLTLKENGTAQRKDLESLKVREDILL